MPPGRSLGAAAEAYWSASDRTNNAVAKNTRPLLVRATVSNDEPRVIVCVLRSLDPVIQR